MNPRTCRSAAAKFMKKYLWKNFWYGKLLIIGTGGGGEKTKCWMQYDFNYVREKLQSKRQGSLLHFQFHPVGVYSQNTINNKKWKWKLLIRVWLFATPWTIQSWNSPGQNPGVGSLSLLQGIFPTQGSNLGLLHCRRILHQLSHQGSDEKALNVKHTLSWGTRLRALWQPGWERNMGENGYMYIWRGLFAVHLKLPQHC